MSTPLHNNNNDSQSNPRKATNFSYPLLLNQQQERATGNTQQPEVQVYEGYHNLSKSTNKTGNDQAIELKPMRRRSDCNKPPSDLPGAPSQNGGNSDKPPPNLHKPLPDLPPEAFELSSVAISANIKEPSAREAKQTSNNTVGNRVLGQAIQGKWQYRETRAQSRDDPAQNLRQLQEKEHEGRAMKSRDGVELGNQAGESRRRVRWSDIEK